MRSSRMQLGSDFAEGDLRPRAASLNWLATAICGFLIIRDGLDISAEMCSCGTILQIWTFDCALNDGDDFPHNWSRSVYACARWWELIKGLMQSGAKASSTMIIVIQRDRTGIELYLIDSFMECIGCNAFTMNLWWLVWNIARALSLSLSLPCVLEESV